MFQSINNARRLLCAVSFLAWVAQKRRECRTAIASEVTLSWSRPDERRVLHSDLSARFGRAMYGCSSLPLVIVKGFLAVMGFRGLFIDTGCHVRKLRALKFRA